MRDEAETGGCGGILEGYLLHEYTANSSSTIIEVNPCHICPASQVGGVGCCFVPDNTQSAVQNRRLYS